MKPITAGILLFFLFSCVAVPATVYAVGESNIDGGGGGFGTGSSTNFWNGGDDGIRITVVNAETGEVASSSVDLTNKKPDDIKVHFVKVSKTGYRSGAGLSPKVGKYQYINPGQTVPKIIPTSGGKTSISAIKSYFTDEQVLRGISEYLGMDYNVLIGGEYKLLIEPIAYVTFEGVRTEMTATEAALYNRLLGGLLRSRMPSLSHKNLPLAMFLETADLGYPAWSGSTTDKASDENIISSLGLGIVKFKKNKPSTEVITSDYEYRVDTDVITSVTVSGGQADPDHPVTVRFTIEGRSYTVGNVYYPEGSSQLVWVKWHTPSIPKTVSIQVSVSGGGSPGKGTLMAEIVDLSENEPPNPVADDRNDSYSWDKAVIPTNMERTSAHWGIWTPWWKEKWVWHPDWHWISAGRTSSCEEDCDGGHGAWMDYGEWVDEGKWMFNYNSYTAELSASMNLYPDAKAPTATVITIKSGYGVQVEINSMVSTSQSSSVTGTQNAVSYFPEFYYKKYWRLLEQTRSGFHAAFAFQENPYSTYQRRTHFTPIWMPDGTYKVYTWLIDCWTPDGMLCKNLTDSVQIQGNLWSDWHCAPTR